VVATFSKGMKQKLAVVRAVFHEPDVVFFDEPTAGLDPESARVVRRMIASLKAAGRTIIVCTHNLSEAAELADVVAVIRGRLVALGPPHALGRAGQPARYRVTLATPADSAHRIVLGVDGVREVHGSGSRFEFEVADVPASIPRLVAGLVRGGHEVLEVRELERSLEDAYLEVIREDE
jgi:ABC-2 type transport system ATP-binding protein